jgi:N-methylhydantoinase B
MPLFGTVDCAVLLTICSILLDTVSYGNIPQNSGLTCQVEIFVPKCCLANPIFSGPAIARFCSGNQLADTCMRAFAQVVPQQISDEIGNLRVVATSGLKKVNHWVHMVIMEGSYDGRFDIDGMDAVDMPYANTRNNPVEDIESHIPLLVERYFLR